MAVVLAVERAWAAARDGVASGGEVGRDLDAVAVVCKRQRFGQNFELRPGARTSEIDQQTR